MPLSHPNVWAAIDALAARNGLTASGLARRAGLDATSFNKSKRISVDGRPRWPSTESVSKVLAVTDSNLAEFAELASAGAAPRGVPVIGFAQAGAEGYFDDAGFPVGQGWDEVTLPGLNEEGVYALQISGDSMSPVYRDGDRIIVKADAPLKRGDRVVVKTREGEVMAKELERLTAKAVELRSLNAEHADRAFKHDDLVWMARILWASQ